MNIDNNKFTNEFMEKYENLVHEVAYRMCKENDDDAIQCGRIGLWEAIKVWDGLRPFEPLARRCIRNNIIDYIRKPVRQEDELTDEIYLEDPEEDESKEELLLRINSIFARRSRERKILTSLINGKSKRSVAQRLGISERTVKRIATKAIERIEKEKQGQ